MHSDITHSTFHVFERQAGVKEMSESSVNMNDFKFAK